MLDVLHFGASSIILFILYDEIKMFEGDRHQVK